MAAEGACARHVERGREQDTRSLALVVRSPLLGDSARQNTGVYVPALATARTRDARTHTCTNAHTQTHSSRRRTESGVCELRRGDSVVRRAWVSPRSPSRIGAIEESRTKNGSRELRPGETSEIYSTRGPHTIVTFGAISLLWSQSSR